MRLDDRDPVARARAERPADERTQQRRPGFRRAAVRGLGILLVLLAWLSVAGLGGPLVGRLSEVQNNDSADFLPARAESTRVRELASGFYPTESLPYLLVVEREGGLRPADLAALQAFADDAGDLRVELGPPTSGRDDAGPDPEVGSFLADQPRPVVPSEDGEAALVPVPLDRDTAADTLSDGRSVIFAVAQTLRDAADEELEGDGLVAHVAGPGGVLADFVVAFEGIDGRLLQVTLVVVFVILLLVYRSPVLPFAALLTALLALAAAGGVIYPLADRGVIDLDGQSQGILFILVVGAATDYALLLVSRYREELHEQASKYLAMRRAWRATVAPVVASAATVVLGLLCLLLAELGSTRGLGPVGAIGIAMAMVSVLTFLPVLLLVPVLVVVLLAAGAAAAVGATFAGVTGAAVAAVLVLVVVVALALVRWRAPRHSGSARLPWVARPASGRWLFWPRVPRTDHVPAAEAVTTNAVWGRVARLVGNHPRAVWAVTSACLLALAAFVPTFKADGVSQTDVFRDRVESVEGQEVLAAHFDAGFGSPAVVVTSARLVPDVIATATGTDGVAGAVPVTLGTPGTPAPPKVVNGLSLVEVLLEPDAGSPAAEAVVEDLRQRLDSVSTDVLVGGSTAINLDVRGSSDRDLRVIIPAVLLVIFVVLVALLRSLAAPLLLIVANVVSFGATIGTSALVFNHVLDLPGGDPAIPLYGFVFLVALGIDYSIFLMTRVREESRRRGTRPGILVGLAVTGGVITSAGVVLASTFSALITLPILFLLQIAFIVAFGVLLDTLVVRSLLVPAMAYDLGRRVWWPGRLARRDAAERAA